MKKLALLQVVGSWRSNGNWAVNVRVLVAVLALATLLACSPQAADPVIDAARMAKDVQVLASDEYEGRGVNTPGETKTVQYLTDQFQAAGLEPGGDPLPAGGRAWTQDVSLAKFEVQGEQKISAVTPKGATPLVPGQDISIHPSANGETSVDVKNAPVVFVGYGVNAPERTWNDYEGTDLHGKIMLVLVNDPDFETGRGDFGGKAMTYYGRWTYKFEEAARQGAAGVLVIHETAPAAYPWSVQSQNHLGSRFDIVRTDPTQDHTAVEGWIHLDAAKALLASAGQDYDALKQAAQQRGFKAIPLNGVALNITFETTHETIVSKNVVGLLSGTARPDETVIYTAHWDHLGIGEPDSTGDTIYNGAVDNGTGLATLLELARAFGAPANRPERSVVFLAVTAEESGLLGSAYYAANPLYPIGKTVANLNMDGPPPLGPVADFSIRGNAPQTLQDDMIAAGARRGLAFVPEARPEAGRFYRSDHFNFAKVGVPAISLNAGSKLASGADATPLLDVYLAERYHQPSDEYETDWNFDGIVQDTVLLYDLGRQLADSNQWPTWKDGAEFKAERDKTAAERGG